jgi:hypothetical protein
MEHVKPIAIGFLVLAIGISMICYSLGLLHPGGHYDASPLFGVTFPILMIVGVTTSFLAVVFIFYRVLFALLMKAGREVD